MNEQLNKYTINMTAAEFAALEQLAELTGSRPKRGRGAYQPSWVIMVRRIARGEFHLRAKEAYRNQTVLERLDDAIAANAAGQAEKAAYKQLSILESSPA